MLTVPYLKIFIVFSSFPLIIGDNSQNRTTSVDFHQSAADGEQFVKNIVHGKKISENPGILMFTAPYKLCEGGCRGSDGGNLAMGFPLYIGKKGMEMYRKIYPNDYIKIHKNHTRAPFKKKLVHEPRTPCKMIILTKIHTTESTTTTTAAPVTCPVIPPGICWKKRRTKKSTTAEKPALRYTDDIKTDEAVNHKYVSNEHGNTKITFDDDGAKSSSMNKNYGNSHKKSYKPSVLNYHYSYYLNYKRRKRIENISSKQETTEVVTEAILNGESDSMIYGENLTPEQNDREHQDRSIYFDYLYYKRK